MEHQIIFNYDEDDNEVFAEVHLKNYRSFFQRAIVAVKYVFGYKCKYGNWDSFIFKKKDAILLSEFISTKIQ